MPQAADPDRTDPAGAPDVTDDALLGGRVRLLQPSRGYRTAIDAVLLAAAVPAMTGQRVLDVGCGTGAVSLCLLARLASAGLSDIRAVGLELQELFVDLARRNAARNGFTGIFDVRQGDVASPPPDLGNFDHVMSNPPYLPAARADPSPDRSKALATVESTADLSTWLGFCLRSLRPGGTLNLVHRADRQAEIIALLLPRVAEVTVLPLLPHADAAPRRVILRARPGIGARVRNLPGLVLHVKGGGYMPEAEAILRDAAPLEVAGGASLQ